MKRYCGIQCPAFSFKDGDWAACHTINAGYCDIIGGKVDKAIPCQVSDEDFSDYIKDHKLDENEPK